MVISAPLNCKSSRGSILSCGHSALSAIVFLIKDKRAWQNNYTIFAAGKSTVKPWTLSTSRSRHTGTKVELPCLFYINRGTGKNRKSSAGFPRPWSPIMKRSKTRPRAGTSTTWMSPPGNRAASSTGSGLWIAVLLRFHGSFQTLQERL